MKSLWLGVIICSAVLVIAEGYNSYQRVKQAEKYDQIMVWQTILGIINTDNSILEKKVDQLMGQQTKLTEKMDQLMNVIAEESSCPKHAAIGVYQLKLPHSAPFLAFCKQGWIVIQRRINGRVTFNRAWSEYRDGFGDVRGEHWLGLERMHQITRNGSYELIVVLKSFIGVTKWAKFAGFKIASEIEQYRLDFGKFSGGDAGNSLALHNGMKFSTPDRDNDKDERNCAQTFKSGWWFNDCYESNLNGVRTIGDMGIEWRDFDSDFNIDLIWKSLNQAEMLIRAIH